MDEFEVRILRNGRIHTQRLTANTEIDVKEQIDADAGIVLQVKRLRTSHYKVGKKHQRFALTLWLQELSLLLEAGLELVEAIEALRDNSGSSNKTAQAVQVQLLDMLYQGQPLSQAMKRQPKVFPALLVATVASAEGSGQLPAVLKRYQFYEIRLADIRKRIIGVLIYPAILMLVGAGILLFMLFFVIPNFSAAFEAMENLSATVEVMRWWTRLVQMHDTEIYGGMLAFLIAMIFALRMPQVRDWISTCLFSIPKLRGIVNLFVLARFYRSVGLLVKGGTTIPLSLQLSRHILPAEYAQRLASALVDVNAGMSVAEVLTRHRLTTSIAERLLRVGEKSGDLGDMCERIAQFHDSQLDHAIEIVSKVLEPLLLILVSGLVGTIVILLYTPIFELAGSIE